MFENHLPDYKKVIALVKDPKAIFPLLLVNGKERIQSLIEIEDKTWENFGNYVLEIFFWSDTVCKIVERFDELDCLSQDKFKYLKGIDEKWQVELSSVSGFYEALLVFEKNVRAVNKTKNGIFYILLSTVAQNNGISLPGYIIRKWKNVKNMDYSLFTTHDLISEVQDTRRKKTEENYFVVDSLALLNTFAKNKLKEAKDTSKSFNLSYKYALPLTEENVDLVLENCPNREFRKRVHARFFNVSVNDKWNNSQQIKDIISTHYNEAKFNGYSSVCREVSLKEGIEYSEVTNLLNSARSSIFLSYADYMKKLEDFAKENLDITVIRDWDFKFVKNEYEKSLKENATWGSIIFDKEKVWKSVYSLVDKIFGIKIKELDEDKIYVNDKVLGFYKDNKMIGALYVSTETRYKKTPLPFYDLLNSCALWGQECVPMGILNLHLGVGANFDSLPQIEVVLHEMGHAIQSFVSLQSHVFSRVFNDIPFFEGMEDCLLEFPSQWLEEFAYQPDFIQSCLSSKVKKKTKEQLQKLIDYYLLNEPLNMWNMLYFAKLDWVIHRNKNCLNDLDTKIQHIKKEFGIYTSKKDKALTDFDHFHLKGKFFSYLLTKNLVDAFNNSYAHLTLKEKGDMLINWYLSGGQDGLMMRFRELCDLFTYRCPGAKLA